MIQIIKVRPRVELKAMQAQDCITSLQSFEIFGHDIRSYSIDLDCLGSVYKIELCNGTILIPRNSDWIINQYGSIFVVSDYDFQRYYNQPEEDEPTPTINNITLNITNNSKDDFAKEIMEVIRKYGVGK